MPSSFPSVHGRINDLDSHLQSSEGIHVIRLPEHAGLLSPMIRQCWQRQT